MTEQPASEQPRSDQTMDQLRLFLSLRALSEGGQDPEALRAVATELTRLESELKAQGETLEPFRLVQEDLDNLLALKLHQDLEPVGKLRRFAPLRWWYELSRKLILGAQRRYNESVTYLLRRVYAASLLTRYYQLRLLVLERRLTEIETTLARLERPPSRPASTPGSPETRP